MTGGAAAAIAGGTESMSLIPMGGHKIAPNPTLVDQLSGRLSDDRARRRERTRAKRRVSREEQDAFALRSHQRAVAAIDAGRFDDEIVAVPAPDGDGRHREP